MRHTIYIRSLVALVLTFSLQSWAQDPASDWNSELDGILEESLKDAGVKENGAAASAATSEGPRVMDEITTTASKDGLNDIEFEYGLVKPDTSNWFGQKIHQCTIEQEGALEDCDSGVEFYKNAQKAASMKAKLDMAALGDKKGIKKTYDIGGVALKANKAAIASPKGPVAMCGFGGLSGGFLGIGKKKPRNVCGCTKEIQEFASKTPTASEVPFQEAAFAVYEKNAATCAAYIGQKKVETVAAIDELVNYSKDVRKGLNRILAIAGGVAAVGVGYKVINDKKKRKKKRRAAAQAKKEYDSGIITMNDGSKKECFTTENYQSEDCRSTLQRLCQTDEHAGKSGCSAFNGYYCGASSGNENSAYCNFAEAKSYCSRPGEALVSSPSCKWIKSRPASCMESPNDLNCLAAMSQQQLINNCNGFPHDPLCKKATSGMIVTQPTDELIDGTQGSNEVGGSTESARGLSSVVESNNSSSSRNLWGDTSSTLQNAYSSGQLTGGNQ